MTLAAQCPLCQHVARVPAAALSRRARCPSCGQIVLFIQPAAQPPAASEPALHPVPALAAAQQQAAAGSAPPQMLAPAAEEQPRKRAKRDKRPSLETEMDLTPMVDVTFQLLIFFMVTASFTLQKSKQIPKPQTDDAAAAQAPQDNVDQADLIIVTVDKFSNFVIEASAFDSEIECPSEQELRVKLAEARKGDAQGNIPNKLLVKAHNEALHSRVVTALDAGEDVGIEELMLQATEDDEGE